MLQIAGLVLIWLVIAIGALVLFGNAINNHSDFGVIGAVLCLVAGGVGLIFVTVGIFKIVRSL